MWWIHKEMLKRDHNLYTFSTTIFLEKSALVYKEASELYGRDVFNGPQAFSSAA